jgi:uncharacterized RDD family membrane protein YckC
MWEGKTSDDVIGVQFYGGLIGAVVYALVKDALPGGRSVGKRVMGLMVVHLSSNRPCNIWRSALRTLVLLLSNGLPAVGSLIEPLLVLLTKDHRRLGDRAAGTQVIDVADYRPGPPANRPGLAPGSPTPTPS